MNDISTAFAEVSAVENQASIEPYLSESGFLNSMLNSISLSIFVLTKERKIKALNESALTLTKNDEKIIINNVFGNAISCESAIEAKTQCGSDPKCKKCPIPALINQTIDENPEIKHFQGDKKILIQEGKRVEKWFNYTFEKIHYKGNDFILLVINDITEIEIQRHELREQQEQLMGSVRYAKLIQTAMLPPSLEMFNLLREYFLIYYPRDVVSGDFYWISKVNNKTIVAVGDCTGHGVPGSLLTMLGISALNDIVKNSKIIAPDEILNRLRARIVSELNRFDKSELNDGMDIAICSIDVENKLLHFAGAYNGMFFYHDGELIDIPGDRMPVGKHHHMEPFMLKEFSYTPEDKIYMFSDGFKDQFGGPNNNKFGKKQFKELLFRVSFKEMTTQKIIIENEFADWKGSYQQIDDVALLGIKLF